MIRIFLSLLVLVGVQGSGDVHHGFQQLIRGDVHHGVQHLTRGGVHHGVQNLARGLSVYDDAPHFRDHLVEDYAVDGHLVDDYAVPDRLVGDYAGEVSDLDYDYDHPSSGHGLGLGSLSGLSRLISETGGGRGSLRRPGPVIYDDSSVSPRFLNLAGAGDYFVGSHRADNLGLFSVDNLYVHFADPVDFDVDYEQNEYLHSGRRRHRNRGHGKRRKHKKDRHDDHDDYGHDDHADDYGHDDHDYDHDDHYEDDHDDHYEDDHDDHYEDDDDDHYKDDHDDGDYKDDHDDGDYKDDHDDYKDHDDHYEDDHDDYKDYDYPSVFYPKHRRKHGMRRGRFYRRSRPESRGRLLVGRPAVSGGHMLVARPSNLLYARDAYRPPVHVLPHAVGRHALVDRPRHSLHRLRFDPRY